VNLLQNGNKTANITVKSFHRSLTTVVIAQKTANTTDTISTGKGDKEKGFRINSLLLEQSTFRRFAAKYYDLFLSNMGINE